VHSEKRLSDDCSLQSLGKDNCRSLWYVLSRSLSHGVIFDFPGRAYFTVRGTDVTIGFDVYPEPSSSESCSGVSDNDNDVSPDNVTTKINSHVNRVPNEDNETTNEIMWRVVQLMVFVAIFLAYSLLVYDHHRRHRKYVETFSFYG
jgi:hypothetical protein